MKKYSVDITAEFKLEDIEVYAEEGTTGDELRELAAQKFMDSSSFKSNGYPVRVSMIECCLDSFNQI